MCSSPALDEAIKVESSMKTRLLTWRGWAEARVGENDVVRSRMLRE